MTETTGIHALSDPRVERTRAHVLDHARRLLAEEGPTAVTYSQLADRARVTRQTLYRHWPTREALFADLVLEQSMNGLPEGTGTPEQIVGRFLRQMRDDMNDPAKAGPLVALIAQADHEPTSHATLGHIVARVCDALNALVDPIERRMTPDDYARLCGPVMFQRFVAREPVTDQFLDTLLDAWCAEVFHDRGHTHRSDQAKGVTKASTARSALTRKGKGQ